MSAYSAGVNLGVKVHKKCPASEEAGHGVMEISEQP